ncbi:MAG TPA: CPBP family intramembrane glutamic endopeptidase [Kofleriaceae bacterium]|nr:CPBP family intramembrane glutamic endopeptidase [Kofleriaceae bacterium]
MTRPPVSRVRGAITLVIASAGFAAALALRDRVDPWRCTALAALVGIALSAWTLGPRLRGLFAITGRGVVGAVGLGVVLVAATHAGFAVLRAWSPDFAATVRGLYLSIDLGASRLALVLLTTLIVIGEELVWRGVAVAVVGARSRIAAGAASVALYVVPQLPGHVAILIAAATGLGAIFAAQRLITGRLTDAVITHAIWSVCVFILFPVV